jgi:23S rRNA pseudouridine2605 synthase
LARALSKSGYCSRSQAVVLVRDGRVTLNGRLVRDPETPVRVTHDHIAVDDAPVEERPKRYLVMNKPRGLVTTASDEQGRATVYDLLSPPVAPTPRRPDETRETETDPKAGIEWVGPVGRLDKASEGLLLFTNDSKWSARLTDPGSQLEKCYHVQVNCVAGDGLLARIRRGVNAGGDHLRVKAVRVLRVGDKHSWLEISLDEGKNRHIRRLMEGVAVQVLRLVRVSIGPLELGDLKKGAIRPLTREEKRAIDQVLDSRNRLT